MLLNFSMDRYEPVWAWYSITERGINTDVNSIRCFNYRYYIVHIQPPRALSHSNTGTLNP